MLYLRPFLAYHLSHFLYCYIMQKQTSGRISRVPHLPPLCPLTFFVSYATGLLSCLVDSALLSQSIVKWKIFIHSLQLLRLVCHIVCNSIYISFVPLTFSFRCIIRIFNFLIKGLGDIAIISIQDSTLFFELPLIISMARKPKTDITRVVD